MTSISSVASASAVPGSLAVPLTPNRTPATVAAVPSSIVRLSADAIARQAADQAALPAMPTSLRFKDLGARLLEGLSAGATAPIGRADLPQELDNRFSLDLVMASGRQVALTLANRGDEMFVAIDADAALTDTERQGLAALAAGFQDAIDGMAGEQPAVRLAALAQLDTALFQSVDFASQVSLPTLPPERMSLAFHMDAQSRSVHVETSAGKVGVEVDTRRPEIAGSRQQQEKAIARHLAQIDQASRRGHGNETLSTLFKDAFSDISRTATRDDAGARKAIPDGRWALGQSDHAALTGLSDFQAVIEQSSTAPNPARRNEVNGFRYEVAQHTSLDGDAFLDRQLSQQQSSRLSAQFHTPLVHGADLAFNFRSESQNYRYHEIDDRASSSTEIGYKDGRLQHATLEQSVDQSERVRKYVLGRMMSDETKPDQHRLLRDLVSSLAPYQPREGRDTGADSLDAGERRRRISLDALSDQVLMVQDRLELAERDRAMHEQS